jgi:hypothetical protein
VKLTELPGLPPLFKPSPTAAQELVLASKTFWPYISCCGMGTRKLQSTMTNASTCDEAYQIESSGSSNAFPSVD